MRLTSEAQKRAYAAGYREGFFHMSLLLMILIERRRATTYEEWSKAIRSIIARADAERDRER